MRRGRRASTAASTRVVTAAGTDACGDLLDVDARGLGPRRRGQPARHGRRRARRAARTSSAPAGASSPSPRRSACARCRAPPPTARASSASSASRARWRRDRRPRRRDAARPGRHAARASSTAAPEQFKPGARPAAQRPGRRRRSRASSRCASPPACELRELVVTPGDRAVLAVSRARRPARARARRPADRRARAAGAARAFPGHRRVLAAPASLAPLAALAGAVDARASTRGVRSRRWRRRAARRRRRGQPPRPRAAEPPRCCAAARARGGSSPSARPRPALARRTSTRSRRWCRLLGSSGHPRRPGRLDLAAPPAAPPAPRGRDGVHPGAASAARRWPAERWAAVARAERAPGRVVVTGGPRRARARRDRRRATPGRASRARRRPTCARSPRSSRARARVLCGDTGVAHLATALGTPSVVLFGPTRPRAGARRPSARATACLWAGRRRRPARRHARPGPARPPSPTRPGGDRVTARHCSTVTLGDFRRERSR